MMAGEKSEGRVVRLGYLEILFTLNPFYVFQTSW